MDLEFRIAGFQITRNQIMLFEGMLFVFNYEQNSQYNEHKIYNPNEIIIKYHANKICHMFVIY